MDTSPNLALPYIQPAQAQKHVTHNEAVRALDALAQICVISRSLTAPPASPAEGDCYIIPAAATGAWAGAAGRVAAFQDGAWMFYTPRIGWQGWIASEAIAAVYTASGWAGTNAAFPILGINATADTTNRLAVSSSASLFNNAGSGHQLKINKAAAADTASLLYQTGYSGRAELGLAGDDNLHLKVSSDGAIWRESLVVSAATGKASFPAGGVVTSTAASVTINVPTDAATIQDALDRLMSMRFEGTATGTVLVANGTYVLTAPLACRHPQPGRIQIKASNAATLPVEADFTGTKATDETMVRTKYKVIVECPGISAWAAADSEAIGLLQDIAFIRTGTTGTPAAVTAIGQSRVVLNRCALSGFTNHVQAREQGNVKLTNCQLAHASGAAVQVLPGGFVLANATLIQTAAGNGIEVNHGQFCSDTGLRVKAAAGTGCALTANGQAYLSGANLTGNTGWGVLAQLGSRMEASFCTIQGGAGQIAAVVATGSTLYLQSVATAGDATQRSFSAYSASVIATAGSHTGTPLFSPSVAATGNNGAWTF